MTLDLSHLLPVLRELPEYQQLLRELRGGSRMQFNAHLPRSIRPALVCALHEDLDRQIFYVTARQDRFLTLKEEIPLWKVGPNLWTLPEPGPLFYEWSPWGDRILQQRIAALAALTVGSSPGIPPEVRSGVCPIVIAPARAVMTRTLSPQQLHAASQFFRTGATVRYTSLVDLLVQIGYAHEQIVTEPGQMSRRGGLLDVWPPADELPTRIEFFGDEIESLRSFDPGSQRTAETIEWVRITPAREAPPRYLDPNWARLLPPSLPKTPNDLGQIAELYLPLVNPEPTGALRFLESDAILLLDDEIQIENVVEEIEEHAVAIRSESARTKELDDGFPLPYLTKADLQEQFSQFARINFGLESNSGRRAVRIRTAFYARTPVRRAAHRHRQTYRQSARLTRDQHHHQPPSPTAG